MRLAVRKAFRDHYRYTSHDVAALCAQAVSANATALMTTEKDAVRLATLVSAFPLKLPLKTVHLHIEIEDEHAVVEWLMDRLLSRPSVPSL
jgi:tetraacyldisaccharide-1-P 4'-kinase